MRMSHYAAESVYHMAHFLIFHERIEDHMVHFVIFREKSSQRTLAVNRFTTKLKLYFRGLRLEFKMFLILANLKVNLSSRFCNFVFNNNNFPNM